MTATYSEAATQRRLRASRAAERVEIGGRLVAPLPDEQHGSESTYNNWCCRCVRCSVAAREASRVRRERSKQMAAARLARIRHAAGRR